MAADQILDEATEVHPIKTGPAIVVRASNVKKSFGQNEVLKGINLEVHRGKVVVILGPSGSGKSTLLRTINHLESIDSGSIQVDGVQIGYVEKNGRLEEAPYPVLAQQRRRIGMVFQSFNLFPHMTVLENVMEAPVHVHGEDPELVGEVLNTIRDLAKEGFTMVVVTHEIPFSREVADWVVFMADGRVVEEGKPRDVLVNPQQPRTREFLKRYI